MKTSIPIQVQAQTLRTTSPAQVIVVALIYSFLLLMSFGIISLSPREISYSSYVIALVVLSLALLLLITTSLYKGISVINERPRLDTFLKFKKFKIVNWKFIAEFTVPAEGLLGLIFGVILWAVANIVVICTYYIFWPLVLGIAIMFGYLMYFVFFRVLKNIFPVTTRCKGSLTYSILIGLFYTVLYNVFMLALGLIGIGIVSI